MLTIQFTTESVSRTGSQLHDIAVMDKVLVFVSEDYLMRKIFSNALFEAKERESAVSPVVGVMLMLVGTIIIAATVSAFAGGLVGTTSKAPQAAFDVKIVNEGWSTTMAFTHLGGDPIDTAQTKIITSWTNRTTNVPYYRETTALPASKTEQEYAPGKYVNLSLETVNVNYDYGYGATKYQEPYFVIPGVMPEDDVSLWYGNFIIKPGDVMKEMMSVNDYAIQATYDNYSMIKEGLLLSSKDKVNVKLVDIPTGQIIFDKDVYVLEA